MQGYIPMQLVAPNAVSTAVMTDAMICSVHFSVSLLLIKYLLSAFRFYIVCRAERVGANAPFAHSPDPDDAVATANEPMGIFSW